MSPSTSHSYSAVFFSMALQVYKNYKCIRLGVGIISKLELQLPVQTLNQFPRAFEMLHIEHKLVSNANKQQQY